MKKIVCCLFIFSCLIVENLFAATTTQCFYKNPSYTKYINEIEDSAKEISKNSDQASKQHTLNIAAIFAAHIIQMHPEYLQQALNHYKTFSSDEKAIFCRSLFISGQENYLRDNMMDASLRKNVYSPNQISLSTFHDFQVKQPGDIDLLWASFFATGNTIYIHKIIEVLNEDEEALIVGYEFVNRQFLNRIKSGSFGYSDLYEFIKEASQTKPNFQDLVYCNGAALWSLNSNASQDPEIAKAIQRIIKSEPSLDYWKKIQKMLNG